MVRKFPSYSGSWGVSGKEDLFLNYWLTHFTLMSKSYIIFFRLKDFFEAFVLWPACCSFCFSQNGWCLVKATFCWCSPGSFLHCYSRGYLWHDSRKVWKGLELKVDAELSPTAQGEGAMFSPVLFMVLFFFCNISHKHGHILMKLSGNIHKQYQ